MCGICGIFEYERRTDILTDVVRRMNQTMIHRGPDDGGVFVGPGIGLGHRRLSIIDLAGGHQPMSNEDGTVWVLLNGEIYNYPELHADLLQRGHKFASKSDTEAIVHLYEDYGEECFAKLRGMFSIAIWDSRHRKLVLARDRVGKKPLFYAADHKRILFGSELKALLAGDSLPREMDEHALSDYFSFGYIPAPKTIYRSVRKVMPGHYLVASANGVRETCYWDISFANVEQHTEAEWGEMLRHELCEATRIRLMSDVPLGAFLSGGIDSSSVVAMMSHLMKRAVTTCSIGFTEEKYNEGEYARQVSKLFSTDHHEEVVEPNAVDIVDKLAWHYDEPFADSSAIPTYYVSKIARSHVTVALGGDGGDENFAGYRRYKLDYYENRLRSHVPAALRRTVFGPLGRWYPALAWAPRVFRAKATFQSLSRSPLEGYFNSISYFRPDDKARLFTSDFRSRLGGYDSMDVFRHYYDRADTDDPLSKIQYVDIKTYLTDDILTKVDRASMAVSLEVRAPLLDHKLMERVAAIPSSLKLHNGTGKYILKKSLEPVLPENILYRAKQGFAIPLDIWFKRELKDMAHRVIVETDDGILDKRFLKKIWDQHQKGYYDRSALLWATLMFRKWHQTFCD
ncbi:MAG: amidotransferase 1, exosortase A system-associated [Acidobacteriia bacterium]|nr:amidotransferase 1, exosortase A system-associated [Terriglobia bacterium]